MHVTIYIIIPKEYEEFEEFDDFIRNIVGDSDIHGYDYISEYVITAGLDKENIKILKNVMMENVKEFNEHLKSVIEEYKKCKDSEEVYFNTTLRYHIDVISTGHILTHQVYLCRERAVTPIIDEETLKDILKNPDEYLLATVDVHY